MAAAILLFTSFSLAIDGLSGLPSTIFAVLVGIIGLGAFILWMVPRQARAIYAEQPSMSEQRTLAIQPHGVEFNQPSGMFRIDWKDVVQWDETPGLLTIFVNRAMFIPIVKADIGEDMTDKIRALLVESGLPTPFRRRPRT